MLSLSLGGYVVLTNVGTSYDAIDASRGLGRATADWKSFSTITLEISTKHVGTGNLTWQLWNETDSVAIGTIADAFSNVWHTRTGTFAINLGAGIRTLRVRVLSSVATDDPAYACATLRAA